MPKISQSTPLPFIALIFGGHSPEHEVSIVTALQVARFTNSQRWRLLPIYLDHHNLPYLASPKHFHSPKTLIQKTLHPTNRLRFSRGGFRRLLPPRFYPIHTAILATHGGHGENGALQGLLELYSIPYTSPDVRTSALFMNKITTKQILASLKLPHTPYIWFPAQNYPKRKTAIIDQLNQLSSPPYFVKPASAGSSIGITQVKSPRQLTRAVNQAAQFSTEILIEPAVPQAIDINCAVLENQPPQTSLLEQPLSDDEFLSYQEKYLKGGKTKGMAGLNRLIPAPLPAKITRQIQTAAQTLFTQTDLNGMVRIDFLYSLKTKKFYLNEVNTIPGSLSFYLWEASGLSPQKLIDHLISLAQKRYRHQQHLSTHFSPAQSLLK